MIRTLLAGTAVAGALTFGAAGLAGAASTTPTGAGSGAVLATLCSKLPTIESKVNELEGAVAARLPKAEARENKAKATGHTKIADAIARRIARVQAREQRLNTRLSKLQAKCGSSSSTTPPGPSASTNTGSSPTTGSSAQ